MSDKYQLPSEGFDAFAALRPRVSQANQIRDNMVRQWRAGFEAFWQTPRTHGDRALSMEDMQAVLVAGGDTVKNILGDSASFLQFVATSHPEALVADDGDDEALLPARYLSAPYEMNEAGQLLSLKPEWEEVQ